MITEEELINLTQKDESPALEFKREWYWDNSTLPSEMGVKWGEFIKDLISLSNAYLGYIGVNRYLIIGYSEDDKNFYDVKIDNIKQLGDIRGFKKNLIERLEKFTSPTLLKFDVAILNINNNNIIVFEMPCPAHVTELKVELRTKTKVLDAGSIIVRKGQKSDEVRIAAPVEYQNLILEFNDYKNSDQYKTANLERDNKLLQERSIEKTVQLYIDKNTSYSLVKDYPKKEKNWKEDIVYEVYKLSDGLGVFKEFIYIHSSANQGKTVGDIRKNRYVDDLSRSIVLTDRPNIKDVEKRKENIKQSFGTNYVYFIDEFGYEFLYKDCILPYQKFNLPVYVDGLYDSDDKKDLSAIDRLKKWFHSENEPLFVVNGHGGIGKTTLAKQFLDHIYDNSTESGILFIESKEIIGELSRNAGKHSKINDVYHFYKAQLALNDDESTSFSRDLLKLSMDNGSLIIVLDGIDEVIAKLGDIFDVDSFISSIFEEYSSDLNRTKVLITCRDHFWNEVGKKILLPEITLKAFNEDLAKEFFRQCLLDDQRRNIRTIDGLPVADQKKIAKAMEFAKSLAVEDTCQDLAKKVYIPFLLDMIGYLTKLKADDLSDYDNISSSFLLGNNHTDFLIAKVCNREIKKLESLGLDDQIRLFMGIATNKENGTSLYDIKSVLTSIIGSKADDSLIEKIKGHPLLNCTDNNIYFRYDVFNVYFKTLYLVDFFRRKDINEIDEKSCRIIRGYLKYDSSFTDAICERLTYDDDILIFCIQIIESVVDRKELDHEMIISSITALLLILMNKSSGCQSNITSRTELIEKIFSTNGKLVGMCLVDIFGASDVKPTFDFRDKVLKDCTFSNYEYFWECSMNENTRFEKSYFKNIDPRSGVNYKVYDNMFAKDCNTSAIQHLINIKEEENITNKKQIIDDLVKIFRLFYERGNFYPKKQAHIRSKVFAAKLLPSLLERKVIVDFKDPEKATLVQYIVDNKYKSVINYIEQGIQSLELIRLADELVD